MQGNYRNLGIIYLISLISAAFIGGVIALSYPNWAESLPTPLRRFFPVLSKTTTQTLVNGTRVVTSEESAVTSVVEKASPAVVSIVAKSTNFDQLNGPTTTEAGIGTGFIIDKKGIVLTNSHVVEDDSIKYTVVTKDKKSLAVKKIDKDPVNDLAILTVDGGSLPSLTLGDSDQLKVGQSVIAIGNALGRFDNTVTVGVVSGIGRGITASGVGGSAPETIDNVLQTDAALNPGNSGGPLLDLAGNVIGVNFATTSGAENIGFVIPINTAKPVVEAFRTQGRIIKVYLGVGYQVIDESIAQLRSLPQGAFVRQVVKDSPADTAGIVVGDIITKIGEVNLDSEHSLAGEIGKHKVGDQLKLDYYRDGKKQTTTATLKEAPSNLGP